MERDLRIAVFGQKRLSREGGVEIVVKELCTRMAQQGCQVTCYNRSGHHYCVVGCLVCSAHLYSMVLSNGKKTLIFYRVDIIIDEHLAV